MKLMAHIVTPLGVFLFDRVLVPLLTHIEEGLKAIGCCSLDFAHFFQDLSDFWQTVDQSHICTCDVSNSVRLIRQQRQSLSCLRQPTVKFGQ